MSRPLPLRTNSQNAFAHYSMAERVPRIARDTLERNPDFSPAVRAAIEQLATAIETNAPLPAVPVSGPDVQGWAVACREHSGETWLDTEWFFAELYFYRLIGHACRYWETGRDPFAHAKEEELAGEAMWARLETALGLSGDSRERLSELLGLCLWGNRVDLSYTIGVAHGDAQVADDWLLDDRRKLAEWLLEPSGELHLVADNTGTELALDLALVDAVLLLGAQVTLHLKMEPVFVSDAMPADVFRLLAAMTARAGRAAQLSARLEQAFSEERLRLAADPFWSSPRYLWQAPSHLHDQFASARAVILKGDANYRRLVGDALWAESSTFADACEGVPGRLACVRTMKSDSVVGLPKGLAQRLDALDSAWRVNGKRGLVQASARG